MFYRHRRLWLFLQRAKNQSPRAKTMFCSLNLVLSDLTDITSIHGLLNSKAKVFLVAFENEQTSETLHEILCQSPRVFLQPRVIL